MNDADLEYGPTPEGADHEHTDIEPSIAGKFAIWLSIAMLISAAIVYGSFWFFEGVEREADRQAQAFPMAAGNIREPQGPRLQTQPFKDLHMLREAERQILTTYGWVDKGGGVVRIPIEDALKLAEQRGLVTASPQTSRGLNQVVQDSASGRTTAPR
jgi:hypothetical protein